MHKSKLFFILLLFLGITVYGQDSALAGEDFDLEALPGVLENISTFEGLEEAINKEGNDVNNLDLDGNDEVDYVLIQMENEGDTYIAFLRVAMSETEMQDVATIEMEKQSATTASFQIVGDEALYGKDYILEPDGGVVDISESSSGSNGKSGPSPYLIPPPPAVRVTICVGVFRPGFRLFVSPYGFVLRPVWFRPWRPIARSTFRARSAHMHRSAFRRTTHRKSHHAHNMQKKHHKSSAKATHNKSSSAKKSTSSTAKKSTSSSATKSNQKTSTTKSTQQKSSTQQRSNTQQKGGASKGKKR